MTWAISAGVLIGATVGAGSAAAQGKKGADIGKAAGIGGLMGAFTGGAGGAAGAAAPAAEGGLLSSSEMASAAPSLFSSGGATGGGLLTSGEMAGAAPSVFPSGAAGGLLQPSQMASTAPSLFSASAPAAKTGASGSLLSSLTDPKNLQVGSDALKMFAPNGQQQQAPKAPGATPLGKTTSDTTTPSSAGTALQSVPTYSFDRKKRLDAMGY